MTTATALPISRDEILDLLTDYVHVVDEPSRLAEWPGFFAADGTYSVITRENWLRGWPIGIMLDDTKDKIVDRVHITQSVWKGHFDEQVVRHTLSIPRIVSATADEVHTETNFTATIMKEVQDPRPLGPFVFSGMYKDTICLEDGLSRFRERVVILDNAVLPTYFVYPL
jgi:anthranilate 1,2-dioxygenase small subunit